MGDNIPSSEQPVHDSPPLVVDGKSGFNVNNESNKAEPASTVVVMNSNNGVINAGPGDHSIIVENSKQITVKPGDGDNKLDMAAVHGVDVKTRGAGETDINVTSGQISGASTDLGVTMDRVEYTNRSSNVTVNSRQAEGPTVLNLNEGSQDNTLYGKANDVVNYSSGQKPVEVVATPKGYTIRRADAEHENVASVFGNKDGVPSLDINGTKVDTTGTPGTVVWPVPPKGLPTHAAAAAANLGQSAVGKATPDQLNSAATASVSGPKVSSPQQAPVAQR